MSDNEKIVEREKIKEIIIVYEHGRETFSGDIKIPDGVYTADENDDAAAAAAAKGEGGVNEEAGGEAKTANDVINHIAEEEAEAQKKVKAAAEAEAQKKAKAAAEAEAQKKVKAAAEA